MGAGKCFGVLCEKYELGDYIIFNKLMEDNNAIVAGGEMTNLYHKLNNAPTFEANDLDIFVQKKEENVSFKMIDDFLTSKGYVGEKMKAPYINNNENIFEVYDYKKDDKKIQVIIIKNEPLEYIKNFDLTCCMYFWNPKSETIEYYGKEEDKGKMVSRLNFDADCKSKSLGRANKYIQRGFKIYYEDRDITELLKFMGKTNYGMHTLKNFLHKKSD